MNTLSRISPTVSAVIAFLLTLPIGVIFSAIVFELRPIETALKAVLTNDGNQPNTLGYSIMIGGLIALPFALFFAVYPMFMKDDLGKRHFYLLNAVITAIVLVLMFYTWGALAEEIYRCDILGIPNCD
jgi:Na+/melibiose symporter-like transporter